MPTETSLSSPTLSRSRSMLSGSSCTTSSLAGFVCGAAAGVALALLFTPLRGAAVRARLRNYASDGTGKLQVLIESGRSMAQDYLHQTASVIEEGRRAFRTSGYSSPQPLTASVAEISGTSLRFEEPLGG